MKVGILSMQRVMNYGSFLQGFALKKTIEMLGHQCEFIEIEQGKIFPGLERNLSFLLKKIIERYLHWNIFTRFRYTRKFQNRFRWEFFKELGIDVHSITHFDIVVIGSDEVFNFAQRVPWGYTLQLYGKLTNADKVISYAASFGHTTMEDILYYGVTEEISSAMRTMQAISVRDINSFEIVKRLTGKDPQIHIDPVLMFDFTSYIKPTKQKDYIIIYTYANRIKDREEITAIKSFARKYGKKIISIGFYLPWCDETIIPDPFEVMGYIKGADYVITDTFHGSVMSLKFNRKFAALVRTSNQQKMTYLLSQFRLEDRIVYDMSELDRILSLTSDYSYVNSLIKTEQENSLNYLKENL